MADNGTSTNKNVLLAKPLSVVGGVFVAPAGTPVPTDASSALPAAFKTVGFISQDAVTRSIDRSVDNIYAWGGFLVATSISEVSTSVSFSCMEYFNPEAQRLLYGRANVVEDGNKITIKGVVSETADHCVVVIDVKGENGIMRVVYPDFQVTEVEDVQLSENEATVVPVTGVAFVDAAGASFYEYLEKN